jgi:hypothetical protein
MSNEDNQSSGTRSASPLKRGEDGNGEARVSKRRKVVQVEHPTVTRELAPKTLVAMEESSTSFPSQPSQAKEKGKTSHKQRRPNSLNLKNYPSNHHPVGIGIWILQKVEQARKELESQRLANSSSGSPRQESQAESLTAGQLTDRSNVLPGQEQEAERLQAQRNRKSKQRQENWAKSKRGSSSLQLS